MGGERNRKNETGQQGISKEGRQRKGGCEGEAKQVSRGKEKMGNLA